MFSSVQHYTGLSGSGIDVESMVNSLMQSARAKYDKMFQSRQKLIWKKEQYRDMNTTISTMRDAANKMKLQGSFMVKKASSADETKVTATGSAVAVDGTSSIKVEQLAQSVSKMSSGKISIAGGSTFNLATQFGIDVSGVANDNDVALSFRINGKQFDYTKKQIVGDISTGSMGINIYNIVSDINAANLGVRASYDADTDMFFINTLGTGSDKKIDIQNGTVASGGIANFFSSTLKVGSSATNLSSSGTVSATATTTLAGLGLTSAQTFTIGVNSVGSSTITVANTTTVQGLLDTINNDSTLKGHVKASYDATNGCFFLTSLDGNKVTWTDDVGSSLKNTLKLADSVGGGGQDAIVYLNNMDSTPIIKTTNTFTINGITYNLKDTTSNKYININISTDVDSVFNNIKSFMDTYNSTIDALYDKINEDYYRDYPPLTDEQKADMKDADITNWEQKAQSGLLHNDDILQNALSNLRSNMTSLVSGLASASQLAAIGIVTGDYTTHGKLYFSDTTGDALKEAINENPDGIVKIFTNNASDSSASSDTKGIAVRISESMSAAIKDINSIAGYTTNEYDDSEIGKQITDLTNSMLDEKERLTDKENAYWQKFTNMETYLSQMSSQSSWLSQQLGSK